MHGFEQTFFGEVSTSYEEHVSGLGFDDGGRTLSDSHSAVNTFFPDIAETVFLDYLVIPRSNRNENFRTYRTRDCASFASNFSSIRHRRQKLFTENRSRPVRPIPSFFMNRKSCKHVS